MRTRMKLALNENALVLALVVFNFVFLLLGIALIALGVIYMEDLWWPHNYISIDFLSLSTFIVIVGAVSVIMSVIGCICLRIQRPRCFHLYILCMMVLLLLEVSIAVIAFLNLNEDREGYVNYVMTTQLANPNDTREPTIYQLEQHFKCCGINGVEDYLNDSYAPQYCCRDENNRCTQALINSTKLASKEGCASAIVTEIQSLARQTGWYVSVVSCLQGVELMVALLLVASVRQLL